MLCVRMAHSELSTSIDCHCRLRARLLPLLPHAPTGHARGHRRSFALPHRGPLHREPSKHLQHTPMAIVETSVDHAEPCAEEPRASAELRAEEPRASAVSDAGEREMWDLEDLLSKLNPMAKEFIPPSLASPVGAGFWSCRRRGEGGSAAMATLGGTGTAAAPLVVG
jgi:hypothetical protein